MGCSRCRGKGRSAARPQRCWRTPDCPCFPCSCSCPASGRRLASGCTAWRGAGPRRGSELRRTARAMQLLARVASKGPCMVPAGMGNLLVAHCELAENGWVAQRQHVVKSLRGARGQRCKREAGGAGTYKCATAGLALLSPRPPIPPPMPPIPPAFRTPHSWPRPLPYPPPASCSSIWW